MSDADPTQDELDRTVEAAEALTGAGEPPELAGADRQIDWQIARREYYAMGEVCDIVGLKPHVLRYWETQFPVLNPSKNRSGNRVFQRKEIKLILLVKHLLYTEKYSIEGARQKLDRLRKGGELRPAAQQALQPEVIDALRSELRALREVLAVDADRA